MTKGKEGHAAGRGWGCAKGRVVLLGAASDPCPAPSSAVGGMSTSALCTEVAEHLRAAW